MNLVPMSSTPACTVPRRWPRYRLTTPILVQFDPAGGGAGHLVAASTRDICAGGVYVVSEEPVKPGAGSQIYVACPGREAPLSTGGVVVRSEASGFAIAFSETVDEVPALFRVA